MLWYVLSRTARSTLSVLNEIHTLPSASYPQAYANADPQRLHKPSGVLDQSSRISLHVSARSPIHRKTSLHVSLYHS